jgi:hypothetical protein
MFASNRFAILASISICVFISSTELVAQNQVLDTRQEYVRSSSPTKSGGRVISESIGGQKMVRIARGPGTAAPTSANSEKADIDRTANTNRNTNANDAKYDYPDRGDSEQITAYRQAANQPPQLRFPQQNRLAQCNCNGVPVPPQQLQFPPQNYGYQGFQGQPTPTYQAPQPTFQQQGFPPQQGFGFGAAGQGGYPLQAGLGVPQFNQTGGNWWTPFISGSGYYTPLLNFRNMPQGTYLGQGLIGQPTAYVDGQPFRNLLRYVSP